MKSCWCGNDNLEPFGGDYKKCAVCGTLVTQEDISEEVYSVSDEDNDLYGSRYWKEFIPLQAGQRNIEEIVDLQLKDRAPYWLKYLLKYILPGKKIIEVGGGVGAFSYLLEKIGFQVVLFELSAEICGFINQVLGVDSRCGDVKESDEHADAFIANDVLEHIVKPQELVRYFAEKLSDDGILCLQTPVYDDVLMYEDYRESNSRFLEQLKPQQHIFIFSKKSMTTLLHACGFAYIQFEPACFGDDYDMYLFASKSPFKLNTEEVIGAALKNQPSGLLIKAMMSLYERASLFEKDLARSERDNTQRLKDITTLESLLMESETDRKARLDSINQLNAWIAECEADRKARLDVINHLNARLSEDEAGRITLNETNSILQKQLMKNEESCSVYEKTIQSLMEQLEQAKTEKQAAQTLADKRQVQLQTLLDKKRWQSNKSILGDDE